MSRPLPPSLIAELAPYIAVAVACDLADQHQEAIRSGHACPSCRLTLRDYEAVLSEVRVPL